MMNTHQQLIIDWEAGLLLRVLPTARRGTRIRQSGLTSAPAILDYRQQQFAGRLADPCSSKLKELHN